MDTLLVRTYLTSPSVSPALLSIAPPNDTLYLPSHSFFFFGGLSIPVSQAILAHLFSYNIQWSATIKEVQRSNFFKEIPKIARRFWFPMSMSIIIIAGMVVLSTSLVPFSWQVNGSGWAVIFPLS